MAGADSVSSSKKTKDRIQQLSELRRGLIHHTDAQYGTANDPMFVMHINIDGMIFQGVGPSKKRAKVMASERALAYLGAISADEVQMPELDAPHVDDHTADVFTGLMYYNFEAPDGSAADASLKLPVYKPESMDAYEEYETYTMQDAFEGYIGRNAVSMMSEMRPDAKYEILVASASSNPPRFVTSVRVKGRAYCGEAKSKKVSKGRAAASAMKDLYGIDFGTAEDGMPVYEGSTKVWENYKASLEKEVEMQVTPVSVLNPVEQLNELFPEAEFAFPDSDSKSGGFFRAQFTVGANTYEGIGLSKRDAKANAAANTIEGLEKNGKLQERQAEMEAKRKERQEKQKQTDKIDADEELLMTEKYDNTGLSRNPTVKLQELYPRAEYRIVGNTPLRNTPIRAFIAAVVIGGQNYIGVGRSKKLAKAAAAEKALRTLGYWTEEDELAKTNRLKAFNSDAVPPLIGEEEFGPMNAGIPVHSMIRPFGARPYGRPPRGPFGWNFGRGPRGHWQRGRGSPLSLPLPLPRGYATGYDGQEWYGSSMPDTYGVESEGLDLMVGELSTLVGQILEENPNMGVPDVWRLLQQNPEYQSWRSGAVAANMHSYYQKHADPYSAEYYAASEDPTSGYFGNTYYPQETYVTRGRGGVNVRSWSRDTASARGRGRRGGLANFYTKF